MDYEEKRGKAGVVYGILCHTDPDHIARLAQKLVYGTLNKVYIHVDAKTDILPFKKKLENFNNIHFIENRVSVSWGGGTRLKQLFF